MGIIPDNAGGFGDVEKVAQVFVRNELTPIQNRLLNMNSWVGFELVKFEVYVF